MHNPCTSMPDCVRLMADSPGSGIPVRGRARGATAPHSLRAIWPSTNPRAPACPWQARYTRPPRQARADWRATVPAAPPSPPRSRAPANGPGTQCVSSSGRALSVRGPLRCVDQVMTSGLARPVRARMEATSSAALDEVGEGVGRREGELLGGVLVALDVDAEGGAGGAGAGEAEDDAAAAFEHHADALVLRDGAVDGVLVGEVVGGGDLRGRRASCRGGWRAWRGGRPSGCWRRRCRCPRSRGGRSSCGRIPSSAPRRSPWRAACGRRGC